MAFEIARQMEASGAKIPMVLLLDSCCLGVKLRKRSALEIAKLFRCYLARLSGRERAIFAGRLITNKLKFMFSSLKRKNTANDMADNSLAQVIKASRRAEFKYRPGPYGGKVVLFQIENWHFYQGYRFTPPPDYGWEKLARGGLEIIQVPGDHLSLIREPYVSNVAQKIRAYLKATENEHAAV
jgi:thioesterase domain-containing protein